MNRNSIFKSGRGLVLLLALVLGLGFGLTGNPTIASSHCDATVTDGNSIQTAINAATDGQTICVTAGTYVGNLQIDESNLTLKSTPQHAAIIQTQAGFNAGSGYGGITVLADGVTIDGFKIEQGVAQAVIHTHNANNVTIVNNWIVGLNNAAPRGIDVGYAVANSAGVVIQGNTFNDLYCGVYINQATNLTIDDNHFEDMGNDGAVVFDGTWAYADVDVTNNSATDANYLLFFFGFQGAVTTADNAPLVNTQLFGTSSGNSVHNATKGTFYTTIQAAVTAANPGDTINVAAGTYTEEINLNKAVTIEGANAGIAAGAYPATRGAETILNGGFIVSTSGAKIDGVTIQNGRSSGSVKVGVAVVTSNVTIANTIIENVAAPAQSDGISTQPGNNNLSVVNSTIRNNWRGIYLNPGSGHVFTGNLIESNNGVGVGIGSDGLSNTILVGNIFTGNNLEGWGSSTVGANVSAHFNVFNGGTNGIYHYGGNAIDAINNWWGSASGPSHATNPGGTGAVVSDNVIFDPWLGTNVSTVNSAILDANDVLSGPDGSSATNNGLGSFLVILSKFIGNPSNVPNFAGASAFYDIFVSDATTSDSLTVSLPAAPGAGFLYFYDGSEWKEVLNGGLPISPSGNFYDFVLDNTSTPKLTELDGTPFAGAGNEEIRITPSTSTVAAGETFQVVVDAGSDGLFGVDVSMTFDTQHLSVTNIALGNGLTAGTIAVNTYDNTAGTLRFAYSQLGATTGNVIGTNLVLATISFLAHTNGSAEVALDSALFTDKDGNPATPAPLDSPLEVTINPSPNVYVDVALQGRSDHAGLQLEVKPIITGNILYDTSVTAGRLEIADVPASDYTARVSAPKYLAAIQSFTLPANVSDYDLNDPAGAASSLTLTLRGGDINGDDRINIQDLVLIGVNFGTNTATADINGDGVVNIQDLAIAAGNFGLQTSGPTYPDPWE